jgi:hypothetical protein
MVVATSVSAQETISTDRPGLGFSAATVPVGRVQVETGIPAVTLDDEGDVSSRLFTFPTLLRVGVTSSLELRAGTPIFFSSRLEEAGVEDTEEGFGGLELGLKLATTVSDGPALALIPSVLLPVGDDAFVPDRAAYVLNGVASWSLPNSLGVTAVAGGALNPGGDDEYAFAGTFVGVVSRPLAERVGAYVEGGWFPLEEAENPAYLGGGLTVLVGPMVQVDGFFDRGITDAASDWLFGVGAATRF